MVIAFSTQMPELATDWAKLASYGETFHRALIISMLRRNRMKKSSKTILLSESVFENECIPAPVKIFL